MLVPRRTITTIRRSLSWSSGRDRANRRSSRPPSPACREAPPASTQEMDTRAESSPEAALSYHRAAGARSSVEIGDAQPVRASSRARAGDRRDHRSAAQIPAPVDAERQVPVRQPDRAEIVDDHAPSAGQRRPGAASISSRAASRPRCGSTPAPPRARTRRARRLDRRAPDVAVHELDSRPRRARGCQHRVAIRARGARQERAPSRRSPTSGRRPAVQERAEQAPRAAAEIERSAPAAARQLAIEGEVLDHLLVLEVVELRQQRPRRAGWPAKMSGSPSAGRRQPDREPLDDRRPAATTKIATGVGQGAAQAQRRRARPRSRRRTSVPRRAARHQAPR